MQKLKSIVTEYNPFKEENDRLLNITARTKMAKDVQDDMMRSKAVVEEFYTTFTVESTVGFVNKWNRMTTTKFLSWGQMLRNL